jgi:hypothetical protein
MSSPEWRRTHKKQIKAYQRKWEAAHRQQRIEITRKYTASLVSWFAEYKQTLACSQCGENHPACLDFHHKDEKEKDFILAIYRYFGKKRILEEIGKCMVLCANCHRKFHDRFAGVK